MVSLAPSVAQLATMAIGSPEQRARVQRRLDNLDQAISGRSMPVDETLGAARLDNQDFEGTPRQLHHVPVADRAHLMKSRTMDARMLLLCQPPEYSGHTKNGLHKTYLGLVDEVRTGMLSMDQLRQGNDSAMVELFMRHQKINKTKMLAIRNIHRILDPQDETPILEVIRPTTAAPINYQVFLAGHDMVQWSTEQERALRRRELDQDTYQQFLLVKARGIATPKLIQKLLSMDQVLYEACQERFDEEMAALALDEDATADETPDAPPAAEVPVLHPNQKALVEAHGQQVIDMLVEAADGVGLEDVAAAEGLTSKKAGMLLAALVIMDLLVLDEANGRYYSAS